MDNNLNDPQYLDSPQTIANRLNAQNSTGPRSEEGRRKSALNAVKTGLTGHTVLLPTDDVDRYETHVAQWFADLKPETPREKSLTQSIADTHWRLDRIVKIEHSLYALGRIRFEAALANEMQDDIHREQVPDLLDGYIHFFYEKQLRNLGIQEARLRRLRDKDLKELKQLQSERLATLERQLQPNGIHKNQGERATTPSTAPNGFVFSSASDRTPSPGQRSFGQAYKRSRPSKNQNGRRSKTRKAA